MNENISLVSQELKIIDRNLLTLTGVSKIISFDSQEFVLESTHGPIHIWGSGLELLSLDNKDGNLRIKGKISGFNYLEKINKKKNESLLTKLFKWIPLRSYCYY